MFSAGPQITFTADGKIITGTLSITNNSGIMTVAEARKRMYEDRPSPPRCRERKGGPRSTIYCEQFKAGIHTVHVGRSKTGRWYTWE